MMHPHSKATGAGGQAALPAGALPDEVVALARACAARGGRAWVVGGWVRDALLGQEGKDIDVEVHGLDPPGLERALRAVGRPLRVGRSFDVYKLRTPTGEIDVSLAALEGELAALTDPLARVAAACRRRDLTINSIVLDPLTGELFDPLHGRDDLEARVLRAADRQTFGTDPLRAVRAVQFAARFGCTLDPELEQLCRAADLREVAPERVAIELEKLLMKAPEPGLGLRLGRQLGLWAIVAPEVSAADPEATDAAVDRAARRRAELGPAPRPLALALGALLHTLPPHAAEAALERLRSLRSDGYPLRARVLGALGAWRALTVPVDDAALRALAETEEVALVCELAWAATGSPHALAAHARAEALGVAHTALPPLLYGRDLATLGLAPGPAMGQLLSRVRTAQIQGTVQTPEQALDLARLLLAPLPSGDSCPT